MSVPKKFSPLNNVSPPKNGSLPKNMFRLCNVSPPKKAYPPKNVSPPKNLSHPKKVFRLKNKSPLKKVSHIKNASPLKKYFTQKVSLSNKVSPPKYVSLPKKMFHSKNCINPKKVFYIPEKIYLYTLSSIMKVLENFFFNVQKKFSLLGKFHKISKVKIRMQFFAKKSAHSNVHREMASSGKIFFCDK